METRLAMRMYKEYTTFLQKAEKERRWNPFDDIPWDKVNKDASEELALCAETFCGVEMYLPDYVAGGINVVRKSFGQAWFQANWAYEESKHALALTEYLMRSGKRTDEQIVDFQNKIFDKVWERPFDTPRQMTLYGVIQEMATFVIYLKQRDRALAEKCEALHKIYDLIARDEIAHCRFYQTVVKVLLEEDRDGTLADFAHVFAKFEMPGVKLVPNYDGRVEVMRSAGIDRAVFLQKVYFPILKYLGITRHEMLHASKKTGGGGCRCGGSATTSARALAGTHRARSRPSDSPEVGVRDCTRVSRVQERSAMRHARSLATFAVLAFACSSSNSADTPNPQPGADSGAEGGGDFVHDLVVSMQVTVKPGEELHQCQFVTLPADADVNVVRMSHRYTSGSHHFLVFGTDLDAIPPDMQGQYDCTYGGEPIMAHSRGILYGAQSPNGTFPLPDGVGFPMKAHQVLLLQAHYLNPLAHELVAKVSAGFDTAPADQIKQQAGFLLFYDPFIYLPPSAAATSGIRCQAPSTHAINLVTGFTHYHQRGTGMKVWVDPDASTKSDAPFFQTTDWEHPEDFQGPLTVPPNSVFRMQCDYQNTAIDEVFQGPNAATSEMCVFAGIYYPKVNGDFESCQNLSVTDTGTKACFDVLTCVSACPGGDAPEFTPGGVNVGPCWERCLATSCPGATDLVVQMTTCVGNKCGAECAMGEDACNTCATNKCAAELGPCLVHACPP